MSIMGLTQTTPVEIEFKPSISNWLPHVGKFTRSSKLLVTIEHQTIHKATEELEVDCREPLEEWSSSSSKQSRNTSSIPLTLHLRNEVLKTF